LFFSRNRRTTNALMAVHVTLLNADRCRTHDASKNLPLGMENEQAWDEMHRNIALQHVNNKNSWRRGQLTIWSAKNWSWFLPCIWHMARKSSLFVKVLPKDMYARQEEVSTYLSLLDVRHPTTQSPDHPVWSTHNVISQTLDKFFKTAIYWSIFAAPDHQPKSHNHSLSCQSVWA
jgi:hypothetical protein